MFISPHQTIKYYINTCHHPQATIFERKEKQSLWLKQVLGYNSMVESNNHQ